MGPAFLYLIRDLAIFLALFGVPGYLLCRASLRDPSRMEALVLSILAGTVSVSILSFSVALAFELFLTVKLLVISAAFVSLASLLVIGMRAGGLSGFLKELSSFGDPTRGGLWALLLGAAVFVIYLVNYDREHFYYFCINQVVMYAVEPDAMLEEDLARIEEGLCDREYQADATDSQGELFSRICAGKEGPRSTMDLKYRSTTGQRFGTTALIAPFPALYRVFGFRLFFALLGFMVVVFTFLLVGRLLENPAIGLVAAAFAALNPAVIKIVVQDENVMALALTLAGLYLLLRDPEPNLLAGMAIGAASGIRHFEIILFPAAIYYVWSASAKDWKTAGARSLRILVPGLLALIPCFIHHEAAYGTIFSHEHFVDEAYFDAPHRFLFWDFTHQGLLNFPFYWDVIRTPFNPFPTFLYYPLYISAHLGLVACGVICVGAAWIFTNQRRIFWMLIVWIVPIACMLSVLEDWLEANKMGVCLTLFAGLILAFGCGLRSLVETPRWKKILALAATSAVLFGMVHAAGRIDVPPDSRFYDKGPDLRHERREYVEYEQAKFTKANLLPDFTLVEEYTPLNLKRRLAGLAYDFSSRDYLLDREWLPGDMLHEAPPVRLAIDLNEPIIGRTDFLRLDAASGDDPVFVDLTVSDLEYGVDDIQVEWAEFPLDVMFYRPTGREIKIYLRFGEMRTDDIDFVAPRFGIEPPPHANVAVRPGSAPVIPFIVSSTARLKVVEIVDAEHSAYYIWKVTVKQGELDVKGPYKYFFD